MNQIVNIDYLLECYRSARTEILNRIKYRDEWLKIQLLSQIAILALAQGIEFAGVKASIPQPSVLTLAPVASLILAGLYNIEDRLIGYLSSYVGEISNTEALLMNRDKRINNFDTSEQLHEYACKTLPTRFFIQLVAFVITPIIQTYIRWYTQPNLALTEILFNSAFISITLYIIIKGFYSRRKTGRSSKNNLLKTGVKNIYIKGKDN